MALYDEIAAFYDPWSRSVTEDVSFYVEEALASGGPVVELAVGTGRIAVPIARAGVDVIGVDSSPGMLALARAAAEEAGVSQRVDLRLGDLREPPVDERVPLVICPFRSLLHMENEDEKLRALRAARGLLEPEGRFVFDVFSPSREDIEETNGRWLEREPGIFERADWDEGARTLTLSVRSDGALTSFGLHWLSVPGVAPAPRSCRLRRRGRLRLVRPAPARRRGGHDLRRPRDRGRVRRAVIWLLVILGLIVVVALVLVALYNRLVRLRNRVDNAWAQIEVQLKRRWDLIPNLVESVKGYAAHERETFEAVTQARTAAQNAQGPAEAAQAEGILSQALGRLFAVAEAYPELRATENFQQLQAQLAETENKVAVSRQVYNDTVLTYHNAIQTFPGAVLAGPFGFTTREFFEVEDEAQREAPKVTF